MLAARLRHLNHTEDLGDGLALGDQLLGVLVHENDVLGGMSGIFLSRAPRLGLVG